MSAMAVWASAGPFVGALVGYGATFFTESRTDARALKRSHDERREARKESATDAAVGFELGTLREVHSELAAFAQTSILLNHDRSAVGSQQLASELIALRTTCSLVASEQIRGLCESAISELMTNTGKTGSSDPLKNYIAATDALGSRIQALYGVSGDHPVTPQVGSDE